METARNSWWRSLLKELTSLLMGVLWVVAWLLPWLVALFVVVEGLSLPGLLGVRGIFGAWLAVYTVLVGLPLLGARYARRRGHKGVVILLLVMSILGEWLMLNVLAFARVETY